MLISLFCFFRYCLLSEQGVSPEMSALASSTIPNPTNAANAAAAAVEVATFPKVCILSDRSFEAAEATTRDARGVHFLLASDET